MAHRVTIAGSALLLMLLPALAQERFAVEGSDFAGVAEVKGQRLEVRGVKFARNDKRGTPVTQGFSLQASGGLTSTLQAAGLTPRPGGGFEGSVAGVPVRLVPEAAPPSDLIVLVVPGLSTNLWNQIGVEYLVENQSALTARGYPNRRLAINTEASVAENAAAIAREVRAEVAGGKRVLLLAHSKGGADTITALSDPANADLLPKVVGLIAIQPVYAGSPVADVVGSNLLIEAAAKAAFECLFPQVNASGTGSVSAVLDLQSASRQALLERHPYPVQAIPTVTVRGHFQGRWKVTDPRRLKHRHPLCKPLVGLQVFLEKRRHVQSDGMVSLPNQAIPGARADYVFEDLDHFEPGFRSESPHTPAAVTAKALELMLPHMKR